MQTAFEQEWRLARTHEINGDLVSAKSIYDKLIGLDPERLYVRLRLSALDRAFGNYRRAREHALKAAETVRKGRWRDLAVVTHLLLSFDERDLVYRLIEQAEWSRPEIIRDSAVLAQHLWLTGQVEASLRLTDLAQARAPSSHLLSYARANALRYCGRMQEATDEYERCLALKPDYATAHWSLAYHARSDTPGGRVDRIKRARASFADDAPEQAYLHYALFKELDDANDVSAAWQSLQAGAGCKRRSTPYSPEREQQGFDALQRLVTEEFIHDRPDVEDSTRSPIFIVGLPRSGTTLLERVVGNHAGVRAGGELNDFNSAMCWQADRFLGMNVSASMVSQLDTVDFSRVGRDYMSRTDARASGSGFFVDKNPMNFVNAGFIAKALPQAKILCLRRAPMDACFSNLKELFPNEAYGYSYDIGELADHYRRFARLCEHWENVLPSQFMTVDYEGLVSEPQAVAAQVMTFCGLPFDPSSVDITRNTQPVATASSSQVRQPINRRGIGAWRKYAMQLEPLRERLGQ